MAATSSFTLVSGSSASGGATSPGEQKGWLAAPSLTARAARSELTRPAFA